MHGAKALGSRKEFITVVFVFVSCFAWVLLPAMDFDEALYVEMSRVMRVSQEYLQPTWDNLPLFDKPPTYMWSLLPFISETAEGYFSGLPRLVPLISYVFMLFFSALFMRRRLKGALKKSVFMLVGLSAFIPTIGSGLLLIDLLMSLSLLPSFLLLYSYFSEVDIGQKKNWRHFTWKENILISGSITLAAWLKGLIAWVIPGLSVIFFALILLCIDLKNREKLLPESASKYYFARQFKTVFVLLFSRFWRVFYMSFLGTLVFYSGLALSGNAEFVKQFFLQHHLGRGAVAMEGHSGSFFYHWLIVFFGGGWLIAGVSRLFVLKADESWNKNESSNRAFDSNILGGNVANVLFPLVWFLTPVIFFSFIATKLPNYTWPSWLALPFVFFALCHSPQLHFSCARQKQLQLSSAFVCSVLGFAYLAISAALIALPFLLFNLPFNIDYRMQEIIKSAPRMNSVELTSCVMMGLILGSVAYQIYTTRSVNSVDGLLKKAKTVAILHGIFIVTFVFGLASYPNTAFRKPIVEAADFLAVRYGNLDILTFGIKSPTFSTEYKGKGKILQVSKDYNAYLELEDQKKRQESVGSSSGDSARFALVVPVWNKKSCDAMLATEVAQFRFLKICIKAK